MRFRSLVAVALATALNVASAERQTKTTPDGYVTVVENVDWRYIAANDQCSNDQFRLTLISEGMVSLYQNGLDMAKGTAKGYRVKFTMSSTSYDLQGNEKTVQETIVSFEMPKTGLQKINQKFGKDLNPTIYGNNCANKLYYYNMPALEPYLRVLLANGGKIEYTPSMWPSPLPGAKPINIKN